MPLQLANFKGIRADENIDDVASGFNRGIRALGNFNKVRALSGYFRKKEILMPVLHRGPACAW